MRSKRSSPSTKKVSLGIAGLPIAQEFLKAQEDAKTLFLMVTDERGTDDELRRLVRRESLLHLIFFCIDLTKSSRARVSSMKSHHQASAAREVSKMALHAWLDKNIHRFKGRLDRCAMEAMKAKGVNRSFSWVRREITAYRATRTR
jgi:hypothetical protein